jgi:hypothetical protein
VFKENGRKKGGWGQGDEIARVERMTAIEPTHTNAKHKKKKQEASEQMRQETREKKERFSKMSQTLDLGFRVWGVGFRI